MSAETYTVHYPAEICFGSGVSAALPEKLDRFRRILLVAGSHFTQTAEYNTLAASLARFEVVLQTGIKPEPPLEDVDQVVRAGRDFQADAVAYCG